MKKIALCIIACSVLFVACNEDSKKSSRESSKKTNEDKDKTSIAEISQKLISCWKGIQDVPEAVSGLKLGTDASIKTNCTDDEIKNATSVFSCNVKECKSVSAWETFVEKTEKKCPVLTITDKCHGAIYVKESAVGTLLREITLTLDCIKGLKGAPSEVKDQKIGGGTKAEVEAQCSEDMRKGLAVLALCQLAECKAAADFNSFEKATDNNCDQPQISMECGAAIYK